MEKEREFVTVEELSVGFSEFSLPQVDDFVGKYLTLNYETGETAEYEFLTDTVMKCTIDTRIFSATYTLVSPRTNIYYFNYVYSYGDTKTVATVLDLNKGIATTMYGTLPTKEEVSISQFERGDKNLPLTSVKTQFIHASINAPFSETTEKHTFTSDLVGERIQFTYSQNDAYEHIYLNDKFYTWHCLKGVEKGLCDTDRCWYLKLDDKLYWFVWAERIVPTIGSVVEDLTEMRSYGTLYGYKDYSMTEVTNFTAGSYAKLLNTTHYNL